MTFKIAKQSARRRTFGFGISLGAAVCSVLAFSCLAEGDGTPRGWTGTAEAAMTGGSSLSVGARRELGLVSIRGVFTGDCPGATVSANWVITSSKCVSFSPNRVLAPRTDGTLAERSIVQRVKLDNGSIMMLRLAPATAEMDWPTVTRGSSEVSVSGGEQVTCYGRGSESTPDGEAEWVALTKVVAVGSTTSFSIKSAEGEDRLDDWGDVGGPCLYNNQLVGITSSFSSKAIGTGGSAGASSTRAVPREYESVHEATPRYAGQIMDLGSRDPETFIHAPNGDFTRSHEDSFVHYLSWDGNHWCARIYGNTFVHAKDCYWKNSHSASIISYINMDDTSWMATVNGKVFTHAPSGDFSRSHNDTILIYKSDGANWTLRLK